MGTTRVYELARELNLSSREVINLLRGMDEDVTVASNSVDDNVATTLRERVNTKNTVATAPVGANQALRGSDMKSRNFSVWISVNILMILFAIYGFRLLNTRGFSDKTGISYVIIALFVLFYAVNVVNTLFFNRELKSLLRGADPQFRPELDAIERPDLDVIQYEGAHLMETHIKNLSVIYGNLVDGKVDQDASLNNIANQLDRREYFVQLGSNLMITLGLIGTVYGLIIAMTGLETVMTSLGGSGTAIIPGLREALQGMGTAFYTTLFGAILGGFFLKLMHQATSNMSDEIIDDISLKTELFVLPHLKKTSAHHINAQSTELTNYVQQTRTLMAHEALKIREYMESMEEFKTVLRDLNDRLEKATLEPNQMLLPVLNTIEKTLREIRSDRKSLWNLFRR